MREQERGARGEESEEAWKNERRSKK